MSERVRFCTDGSITFFDAEGEKLMTLDATEKLVSLPTDFPSATVHLSDIIVKQAKEIERLNARINKMHTYNCTAVNCALDGDNCTMNEGLGE